MVFGNYWLQKQKANPNLVKAESLTLSIDSFRKELEKAFLAGKVEGRNEKPPIGSMESMLDKFLKPRSRS